MFELGCINSTEWAIYQDWHSLLVEQFGHRMELEGIIYLKASPEVWNFYLKFILQWFFKNSFLWFGATVVSWKSFFVPLLNLRYACSVCSTGEGQRRWEWNWTIWISCTINMRSGWLKEAQSEFQRDCVCVVSTLQPFKPSIFPLTDETENTTFKVCIAT